MPKENMKKSKSSEPTKWYQQLDRDAINEALEDATFFDEDDYNTNFDYDSRAYKLAEKNFTKLVHNNAWVDVMKLSLDVRKCDSDSPKVGKLIWKPLTQRIWLQKKLRQPSVRSASYRD